MFDNIGSKVKTLAKVLCWIGIIASIIGGLIILGTSRGVAAGVISGLAVIILGSILSWAGSFVLYAFGDAVENIAFIANLTAKADMEREQRKVIE